MTPAERMARIAAGRFLGWRVSFLLDAGSWAVLRTEMGPDAGGWVLLVAPDLVDRVAGLFPGERLA